MTIKSKRHTKGIITKPTTSPATEEGEQRTDSDTNEQKVYLNGSERTIVTEDQTQSLSNKAIDNSNSISIKDGSFEIQDSADETLKMEFNAQGTTGTKTTIQSSQTTDQTITLPNATDTLVGKATYDVLTNKTLLGSNNVISIKDENFIIQDADDFSNVNSLVFRAEGTDNTVTTVQTSQTVDRTITLPDSDTTLVGTDANQTLTNKTIQTPFIYNAFFDTPAKLRPKLDTLANLESYAAGSVEAQSNGELVFATDEEEFYGIVNKQLTSLGGGGTSFKYTQAAHGFAVGEGIYHNGTSFVKGQANNGDTLAYFVVTEVVDANTFVAADFGRVEVSKTSHGYAAGEFYFLSETTAGEATTTEPTTGFSNPLFYVEEVIDPNTAILQLKVYRPAAVGIGISIDNLTDVDTSTVSPSDNDVLFYNTASGNWEPSALPPSGATQLSDLTDVDTTGVTDTQILAYNNANSRFEPIDQPSVGGGAGATVIAAGGTITGTYNGDVILEGNATMTADVIIKGNLFYTGSNLLSNNDAGYNLTVYGNVFGDGGFIDLSTNTSSVDGGDFTCRGSVYDVYIWTHSGGASSTQPGVSGNVTIQGDYIAPLRTIMTHGGDSTTAGVAPGNGGTVFIGGDAEFDLLWTYGGTSKSSCDQGGSNGGNITIKGNVKSDNTGNVSFSTDSHAILYSGGDSKGVGGAGGNAGSLYIGGSGIFLGGFTGRGGDCTVGSGDGGTGGSLVVKGSILARVRIKLRGGNGTVNGGDADQSISGGVVVEDRLHCAILDLVGGNGSNGNGGNALRYPLIGRGIYVDANVLLNGGDAAAGFTNGAPSENCLIRGGGYIQDLQLKEGTGGNANPLSCKLSFNEGYYQVNTITAENSGNVRLAGANSVVSLEQWGLSSLDVFTNDNNTLTTASQTTPELYLYKFGIASDPVRRSAQYTTA